MNIIQKAEFGTSSRLPRFDAEYVWRSLWDVEKAMRGARGWLLSDLIAEYDGPTLNGGFAAEDAVVRYIDIDSIDTSDGLAYADELFYGDRRSRAKYLAKEGDLLVLNVRPTRGAMTLVTSGRDGAMSSSPYHRAFCACGCGFYSSEMTISQAGCRFEPHKQTAS